MKIEAVRIENKNRPEEKYYNYGANQSFIDESSYDFFRGYLDAEENGKKIEEYVGIDTETSDLEPRALNKEMIKSNIDGATSFTNIQDSNIDPDPTASAENIWKDIGISSLKSATFALSNMAGLDVGSLNNIINTFDFNPPVTKFDEDMSKLNEWKTKKFKDLHPFDWKPGQTIPRDLLKNSIADTVKDSINAWGSEKTKENQRKFEKVVSPDPIKYARDSMLPSKGIYPLLDGDQSEISAKNDIIKSTLATTSGSNAISAVWKKNKDSFSPFNKFGDEAKFINALKNKNTFNKTLGYIYIKPSIIYGSESELEANPTGEGMFQIPFEFNPEISEGDYQASYVSESLLNRIGKFHIYTGTDLSQLSISLKYLALAPDEFDDEQRNNMGKQFATDSWQYYWTNNRIETIEYKLRSLVFPDMVSRDYLVKPPIIEVHIGNESGAGAVDVGDLYKYPININNATADDDAKYLATTRTTSSGVNRYKKYIVTSVQIENFNDDSLLWPSLYGKVWNGKGKSGSPINHIATGKDLGSDGGKYGYSGYSRRTGFKATLRCLEVTENFLDLVPDFKAYYNAWSFKEKHSNNTYDYVKSAMNAEIQETVDALEGAINTASSDAESITKSLDSVFAKALSQAKLYNGLKEKNKLSKYNKALNIDDDVNKDSDFYYINSFWPFEKLDEEKEKNKKKINIEYDSPVFFKVKLYSCFKSFINNKDLSTNEKDILENIYDDKKIDSYNKKIAMPTDNLLGIVDKTEFYDDQSSDKEDVLKIYDKQDGKETAIMENIFTREGSSNDPMEYFTDKECYYIVKKLKNLSDDILKNAKDIEFSEHDEIGEGIDCIIIEIMDSVNEKRSPQIDTDIYKLLLSKFNDFKKLIDTIWNNIKGIDAWDSGIFSAYLLHYLGSNYEKILQFSENYLDNKPTIPNIYNKTTFSLLRYDYENNTKEGEKYFKELKKELNKVGATSKDINYLSNDMFDRYNVLLKDLRDSKEFLIKIVEADQSFYSSSKEAGIYLSKAILLGNNIKCLSKKVKKLDLLFLESTTKTVGDTNNNKPTKNKVPYICEANYYSTYTRDVGITLVNANYIVNRIENTSKSVIKEMEGLGKEVAKSTDESVCDKQFSCIEDIDYHNNTTFLVNDENYKKFTEYMHTFEDNQEELINNIKYIKTEINEEKIQTKFSTIVGYSESEDIDKTKIKKLKLLKDEHKNYSKEGNLRESVFKEWDEADGFYGIDNLTTPENQAEESFKSVDNGEIPHAYYDKYTTIDKFSGLEVANNSINNYNNYIKLTT